MKALEGFDDLLTLGRLTRDVKMGAHTVRSGFSESRTSKDDVEICHLKSWTANVFRLPASGGPCVIDHHGTLLLLSG